MPRYTVPLRDIRFVLHEVHDIGELATLPGHADATPDLVDAVLAEAARLCEGVLAPLNASGDAEGCRFDAGAVRMPAGFVEAYRAYCEGGWPGLASDPTYGGQGLPQTLRFVFQEMEFGANLSFGIVPGLSHGAYAALIHHADEALKARFLPPLVAGRWSGTMCMTEPQSGSDLGLIRSRAEPAANGTYRLTGSKIFISAGEHDLTENILHLVLARLPGAPTGTAGLSLFLVPRHLPEDRPDGTVGVGARNAVSCTGIEEKMGLHASPTCQIAFDGATGWLVGEPQDGMRAMFTMMNAARLSVGLQGLGLADAAYQTARAYAAERLQGRALGGIQAPGRPADPILVHPDIRRQLLFQKSFTEGGRALAHWISLAIDRALRHPDPDTRQEAQDLVALMTPVIKGVFTDLGFESVNAALQVLGGHGYLRDWGIEQMVRDARIAQIYEGTNGIQALDLVGRKLPQGTGRLLRRFFHPVDAFLRDQEGRDEMAALIRPFRASFQQLQQATLLVAQRGLADREEAGAAATDYMHMLGLAALGFIWLRMARTAQDRLAAGAGDDTAFYQAKIATAGFFMIRVLPRAAAHGLALKAGKAPLMELAEAAFQ